MTDPAQSSDDTDTAAHPSQTSKVQRLLVEYDLTTVGEALEEAWTRSDDPVSLRDLTHRFNRRLLEETMTDAGFRPLDGEIENTYRLLTDDDVSPGDATEARRRLERAGIDVDQLTTDFVSRQAIHTFLTKVRGVTHQSTDTDPLEAAETFLHHREGRLATVINSRLAQLREANHLAIGSPRVLIDVQILCEDCGQQYALGELFDTDSCACEIDPDS